MGIFDEGKSVSQVWEELNEERQRSIADLKAQTKWISDWVGEIDKKEE